MLIDYSVTNYRSFRERQTLSLVAASRLPDKQNFFRPDLEGESSPNLLKVAVIYGPNASGKSNLLRGLDALRDIVIREPSATIQRLPVSPFRFDPGLADQPSEFELNFIADKRRFKFILAATQDRIVREQLVAFPKGHESVLYERLHESGSDRYQFGDQLEGDRALHETWQRLTGPQRLFLTQAVANSSEELRQLRSPLKWLQNNLMVLPARLPMKVFAKLTQHFANQHPSFTTDYIVSFIRDLDIPVTALQFKKNEQSSSANEPNSTDERSLENLASANVNATLTHTSALGDAVFEFEEESEGTQNLVGFFMIWSMLRGETAEQRVLSIDEFDSSLHPQIVASLVKKHIQLDPPKQLIFTTHDTHLMDTKILRRDQIWLTERDVNSATQLRAIHDFAGRESEDVEKRYFEGRYRGLPILREN